MSDVQVSVEELRQQSVIYNLLQPGAFLFKHQSKLNYPTFQVALENFILVSTKGKLLELTEEKVERWL